MIGRQRTIRASAVALRKESVDRNVHTLLETVIAGVALRKESVDRNARITARRSSAWLSLSARRAWIEILQWKNYAGQYGVALRKESVDRNITTQGDVRDGPRRSPQGERG